MKPVIGKDYYVKDDKERVFEMRCLSVVGNSEQSIMRWNMWNETRIVHHDRVLSEIPKTEFFASLRRLFGRKDAQ